MIYLIKTFLIEFLFNVLFGFVELMILSIGFGYWFWSI